MRLWTVKSGFESLHPSQTRPMKAMLLRRNAPIPERPLDAVELPTPEPAAGELLVRVSLCAVCRTDLHVIEGDLPTAKLPVIPGHQIVGTVE